MTPTDRICAFLRSKLPVSFWAFHGASIRAFVENELVTMQEVIGEGDTGVSQDQPLDPLPCCDLCSRGLVDFAAEKREPIWRTIADGGCELTLCQDCWKVEVKKEAQQ